MKYCCCEGQTAMDGRHYCAMTLRHLLPGRGVAAQAQLPRQRGLHKRALNSCGIPLSAGIRQQRHRCRVLPAVCKAVKSPEVSAGKTKGTTSSATGEERSGRFGLATAELSKLADSAPQDVFTSQSSIFTSAAQLAQLLDSSLTGGISESSAQIADRGSRLGQNKLPERDQVSSGHPPQLQVACHVDCQWGFSSSRAHFSAAQTACHCSSAMLYDCRYPSGSC